MIPREIRFHTAVGEGGLPDLLEKRISLSDFTSQMEGHWWKRTAAWDSSTTRGLYKMIPEDRFRLCLRHFEETYHVDALDSARMLMHGLLDPLADEAGKPAWIEMTPTNLLVAPLLYRIFPNMKLIHTMRDGRDVAMSIKGLPWGNEGTMVGGIKMWQQMLRDGHRKLQELPRDRVLTIRLEDLVANRREDTYTRILKFLNLQDELPMRDFFDEQISAENAHVGRWQAPLALLPRLTTTAIYECALARLAIAGVSPRPTLRTRRSLHSLDLTRRPQQETIDPWADGQARDA